MSARFIATASALLASTLAAAPATAAGHDTEPPRLTTPVKARFVVGAKLQQFRDSQEGHAYYDVPMRISWTGHDNADRRLNYDVWEYPKAAPPNRIGDFITKTVFRVTGSDYDGEFGGAALVVDHWGVQAYDDAGNSTLRAVYGAHLLTTQDNHSQTFASESDDVSVHYVGAWTRATCACYADRTTHHSRRAGAAAVIRVVVHRAQDLRRVALVMDRGPARGKAQIRVDGKPHGTINTGARTAVHRQVVWTATLGPGTHQIRVVNLATRGRPRIDFDAVVVN